MQAKTDSVYEHAPLSKHGGPERAAILTEVARDIDQLRHPNSLVYEPYLSVLPGELPGACPRTTYDWLRDGARIAVRTARLEYAEEVASQIFDREEVAETVAAENGAAGWIFRFCAVDVSSPFEELHLVLYTPRGIYVYRHDHHLGLGTKENEDGQQLALAALDTPNWRDALDGVILPMLDQSLGCEQLAFIAFDMPDSVSSGRLLSETPEERAQREAREDKVGRWRPVGGEKVGSARGMLDGVLSWEDFLNAEDWELPCPDPPEPKCMPEEELLECDAPLVDASAADEMEPTEEMCGQRRRLGGVSARRLQASAEGCWGGGASPCSTEAQWREEWQLRLHCWWIGLPMPTQTQLGSCIGALGLHLSSRFDAAVRGASARFGGGNGHLATSPAREEYAKATAEPACVWVSERAAQLNLPDFPALPEAAADLMELHPSSLLLPLPRLLEPEWLRSSIGGASSPSSETVSPPAYVSLGMGVGMGAMGGVLTAAVLFVGMRSFGCRQATDTSGPNQIHAGRGGRASVREARMSSRLAVRQVRRPTS